MLAIKVSTNFKKSTTKAIISIIFFLFIYVLLLLIAVGLTILCVIGGFYLITIRPSAITIGLGLGLGSLGFFILAFLFKFILKKHTTDRSHLTEITKENEPKLFQFIDKIVKEVGTDFPNKIYISSEVNASVFYDSSFWSMFFPIKKNLQIGLALINTITEQELKAILAHEFGHFSQKSMKVGSFVYNVNQVIFNLLYENQSFDEMIQKWANISGYFSIFIVIALKIIEAIQWVLQKMYDYVNINYLALSREMEFHADEVAANIAGSLSLQESLIRMDLADSSYNSVLNFYESKITENKKSINIFLEQTYVMHFLAKENNLEIKNNLPLVTSLDLNKFNKSKLEIKNQWASHPSVEDRIAHLKKINIKKENISLYLANTILNNVEDLQKKITTQLFAKIDNSENLTPIAFEEFKNEYIELHLKSTFNKLYNGYYDNKNPNEFDLINSSPTSEYLQLETLFNKDKVDVIYEYIALINDKTTLTNIANNLLDLKSFDYDGQKFKSDEATTVATNLEEKIQVLQDTITKNDCNIYHYYHKIAKDYHLETELYLKYKNFFAVDKDYDRKYQIQNEIINSTQFISTTTPFEQIKANFRKLKKLETEFKKEIQVILETEIYQSEITESIEANLKMYLKEDWVYFYNNKYIDSELEILFKAINDYTYLISRGYFLTKKELLNFQANLLQHHNIEIS